MLNGKFAKISFYIVAHADDWQLFMQPNAYNDLVCSDNKVVFVVTTAGDAGTGKTYWASREEGMKSSIRFCLSPLTELEESEDMRELNSHQINYWSVNNVTCYFLRLPDGNLDGNGFPNYKYQSLSKFKIGQTKTITTVDQSAGYNSWPDFYLTLQTIIQLETECISNKCINYLNPSDRQNPNDHIDHITTGEALQEISLLANFRQHLFVGYSVSSGQFLLNQSEFFWKAGMFAAYEKAVFDNSGYSTLKESVPTYLNWCLSSANYITINPLS